VRIQKFKSLTITHYFTMENLPHKEEKTELMAISGNYFTSKIPNRGSIRDFFQNKMQLYCPPLRDMNKVFITEVLAERKYLLS